jgi:carboxylate-amine ligase
VPDADEAYKDVSDLRKTISEIANRLGFAMATAGTHPSAIGKSQLITDHARYNEIVNELQEAARSNLIFGLHVHVGMETREMANHIANSTRYFLPHIYALSTNSPFWEGRQTGYKSFRTKVFDKFPRTGIPEAFDSIESYENYVKLLREKPTALTTPKDLVGSARTPVLQHGWISELRRTDDR